MMSYGEDKNGLNKIMSYRWYDTSYRCMTHGMVIWHMIYLFSSYIISLFIYYTIYLVWYNHMT